MDIIERNAAKEKLKAVCKKYNIGYDETDRFKGGSSAYELGHLFDDLPSIQPEQPKGHWRQEIKRDDWNDYEEEYYHCSECGTTCEERYNFCPYCGADMRNKQTVQFGDKDTAYYADQPTLQSGA